MIEPAAASPRAMIEYIAKAIVEAEADLGKIIGRSGRVARALRNVLTAAGSKLEKRYALEIIE
jgi:predicted RNA-binding protein YlqC (UPF0109 family)